MTANFWINAEVSWEVHAVHLIPHRLPAALRLNALSQHRISLRLQHFNLFLLSLDFFLQFDNLFWVNFVGLQVTNCLLQLLNLLNKLRALCLTVVPLLLNLLLLLICSVLSGLDLLLNQTDLFVFVLPALFQSLHECLQVLWFLLVLLAHTEIVRLQICFLLLYNNKLLFD